MAVAVACMVLGMAPLGMAEETIKIGPYLPMTGAVAGYGQQEWAGIQLAAEMQPTVLGAGTSVPAGKGVKTPP